MLNILDNSETRLFFISCHPGNMPFMCLGLAFLNEHFFERKGHLKVILKLQTEMSYIKNFLNVVYIF